MYYIYHFCYHLLIIGFFRAAGGKLVDPSPAIQKDIATELDRVRRVYGGADGADMTKFPTFNFPEPKVDPINS